jgi:hypothetical protein
MSAKDEKSKLKKTQALSPDEADKAREKLRAAMAQAVVLPPAAPSPSAPRPEAPPPRAGAPLSPFDAPAPKTQQLGAEDTRKALEQVARARASALAAAVPKTVVMSPEEAKGARALVSSKTPDSPSKIARKPPRNADGPSKLRKPPAVNPMLARTLPLPPAPRKRDTARPQQRRAPTQPPPVVSPARAGAPLSPFEAPAPKTQQLGAEDTRKALEQVARARAAAAGETPPKIARRPPKTDAPSKMRREPPSKMGRKAAAVSPALSKTLPLTEAPRRPASPPKPKVAPAPAKPMPAKPAPPPQALMHGANLHGARLVRADLRGADLRAADFGEADLAHADLSFARLDDANLSFANLYKTKLDGAEMRGCDRSGTRKTNPDRI